MEIIVAILFYVCIILFMHYILTQENEMALSNKSPLGAAAEYLYKLQDERGITPFSSEFEFDAEYEAFRTSTPVDYYQQGLNQEYAAQVQFESLIGAY
jgi:hypothetical protein